MYIFRQKSGQRYVIFSNKIYDGTHSVEEVKELYQIEWNFKKKKLTLFESIIFNIK